MGGSATASFFLSHFGFEGSIAIGVSDGPEGFDAGFILVTGTPTDDLILAVNVGADVFAGAALESLQNLKGPGEALNLVIGPVVATEFAPGQGVLVGLGVSPLPAGISVTETQTRTFTYRDAVRALSDQFCRLDPACVE